MIVFGAYFCYDGAIGYPAQRERALTYQRLYEEHGLDAWNKHAAEQGWSLADPGEPKDHADFTVQFIFAGIFGALGTMMLLVVFLSRGRWIEASETGVTSSWGQSFDFDQVVSLDKKKWEDKGIAYVKYDREGRKKRFVIDDYKFDRSTTDQIVYRLESNIDHDLIAGGRPQSPPGLPEQEEEAVAEPVSDDSASE